MPASSASTRAGEAVTFTATVSANPPGGGTPTGSVKFVFDAGAFEYYRSLVNGVATLTLSNLAFGEHSVSARYEGDGG
jgi:hypothetical protein